MNIDLWNFDENSLKEKAKELPDNILREQAEILAEKTGNVILGRITNIRFKAHDEEVKYSLASIFEVVVPALDNYRHTLFTLYSKPEKAYPVAVTIGRSMIDDAENFEPEYECLDKEAFIVALKEILSSEKINKNISILYSKATL